jgi:hypothetical protein
MFEEYNKIFKEAMDKSRALGKGIQVGKIFGISVADGKAWYEIVKIGKKTVKVKWRKDLTLDGYKDWNLGEGGTVKISVVSPIINWDDIIQDMKIKH